MESLPTVEQEQATAVIIGAGPAGLTAAFELLDRTAIKPVIIEKSNAIGGLSRTVVHRGNRMDIGGHRFFSKSERVMRWWQDRMPIEETGRAAERITYQGKCREVPGMSGVSGSAEKVLLVRPRRSRIYFVRQLFDYPLRLSPETLKKLGTWRVLRVLASYLKSAVAPIRPERNLEEFFINRFGRTLYETFFRAYTEKVWGMPCTQISADWGRQRIKGLSISKVFADLLNKLREKLVAPQSPPLASKQTETSLIERFLYPRLGPGQMWETVAQEVLSKGGELRTQCDVVRILARDGRITAVEVHGADGATETVHGDVFFSTMPVQELVRKLEAEVPEQVRHVSEGLPYRDFITVGLLVTELQLKDPHDPDAARISDNWIYIQEPDVRVGRLQIFNNWSPALVQDPGMTWIGLEYFCQEGDDLWSMTDECLTAFAIAEMEKIDVLSGLAVHDSTVVRVPKAYPGYYGTYESFDTVRDYLSAYSNLFLIGRNGMHRYNNQDHSMLSAMVAVDNLVAGRVDQQNIWDVNAEEEYHEETKPCREARQ